MTDLEHLERELPDDETVETISRAIEVQPARTSMRALLDEAVERLCR